MENNNVAFTNTQDEYEFLLFGAAALGGNTVTCSTCNDQLTCASSDWSQFAICEGVLVLGGGLGADAAGGTCQTVILEFEAGASASGTGST